MRDLISRAEAISKIEKEYREWGEDYCISDVLCDLDDMPSAQQWIPCSEQLPKHEENVLVWCVGQVRIGYLTDETGYDLWILHGSFPFKHDEKKVLAWMPLPEPYEVEE